MIFPTKYNFRYNTWGTLPSSTVGVAIVPGFNNTKGSWTQLASSANLTSDCYLFTLQLGNTGGDTFTCSGLFDIGIDTAGGTNYTAAISNIITGGTGSVSNRARSYSFPLYIPAGSSVAVRVQTPRASGVTARLWGDFFGQPEEINMPVGTIAETLGYTSLSNGTSFTPGVNGVFGSWANLGTTTNDLWWWQQGINVDNSAIVNSTIFVTELAYGDATTKTLISRTSQTVGTNETMFDYMAGNIFHCYRLVPSGTDIWIRATVAGAAVDSGYNAVAIGIGG